MPKKENDFKDTLVASENIPHVPLRFKIFLALVFVLLLILAGLDLRYSSFGILKPRQTIAPGEPITEKEGKQTKAENYAKISAHEHYFAGGKIEDYLAAMEKMGIKKAIFLPTGKAPDNSGYKENMDELLKVAQKYPDKIIPFATVDVKDDAATQKLEDAVKKGAKGLKLIDWLSSYYREPVDSARMYKIYQKSTDLKLPIIIHIDLAEYPAWRPAFEKVLTDFPKTTFIAAHYCRAAPRNKPTQLKPVCGELLDKYPNLMVDISVGSAIDSIGNKVNDDPAKFRNFVIKYQDRILWGADVIVKGERGSEFYERRIKTDLDLLEKTFYRSTLIQKGQNRWGMSLPREVLEKIYWQNPQRILGITP